MAAGVTKRNITNQSSANPISFVSGAEKSMHNPKNASGPSKQGQPQFKPKSKCLVHGNGNHTTEQCKVLKRTATAATITTKVTPPTSSTKKNRYKCSTNVPWSPDHAAEIKSRGSMDQLKLSVLLVSLVLTIEVNIHLPLST
ncbi:hypothetical protein G6F55_013736 [Rhizopus delemar]|uniref:Uncharacterized protein n=2 Tax=Rhizopus TaxID=4842 RepID=A0A9P6XW60_9FUNG|nr:hypothetical protein G6F55_013736 [Rhizopus delemar]KAG1532568.1 hypothetical protein G6F51_013039 [Rhizopus arrhizus]KAG1492094.1 hypothetical protein G6F52_013388 [Rhizopus delemar]KAG1533484.1 hypothetical protein G6F50_015865 [Rhizopus delemar]KAG1536637.1 hypothetical protein G6F49_012945 [Rhizopus delemar]